MHGSSVLGFTFSVSSVVGTQPQSPIIVRIIEPPSGPLQELSDVLLGSVGLTGAIVLLAMVTGIIFAGVLFWIRSRSV